MILLFLAILGLISCTFFACKKEKQTDIRQFDIESWGSNTYYLINGVQTNYNTSTGGQPIKKGDVLIAVADTSWNFPTCTIDIRIYDGNNKQIDGVVSEKPYSQTVSYTIK